MDFILDYITVNTFWTILLIVHGLLAVALLGALTHQAAAVLAPPRARAAGGFVTHFRAVSGPRYSAAVCVLWVLAFILGGWIYTKYRIYVRIPIEQEGMWKTLGAFELKEHFSALGLVILPAYWACWRQPLAPEYGSARVGLTWMIALIVWWNFLVGQWLVAIKGLFP